MYLRLYLRLLSNRRYTAPRAAGSAERDPLIERVYSAPQCPFLALHLQSVS